MPSLATLRLGPNGTWAVYLLRQGRYTPVAYTTSKAEAQELVNALTQGRK